MDVKRPALAKEATPEMRKPTVMIADDHTMIVEALLKLLEPHYQIVATVPEGRRLLETAPGLRPDIVVIDIGMPLLNGLVAGQQLKKILPPDQIDLFDNEPGW
jgi:DNA-binding NarL/FixJ family response regulator